jgi:hypothetical protein
MSTTIRTRPTSLNEWTLEMNIATEIARLFDTPFGIFYPNRLRHIFDILPIDFRRFRGRPAKIEKLTPGEEGAGGGWDTKVFIPRSNGTDDRVVYLQFKSGAHSDGNNIPGSLFNLSIKNPNRNVEFTFNDNGKPAKNKPATQHGDLQRLNNYLIQQGLSNKSVLYAFPRITSLSEFENLAEPLLLRTTFLSVTQMDNEAAKKHINLNDGNQHFFRSCYATESKREISSEVFSFWGDESADVVEEILLVKLTRIWNYYEDLMSKRRLKDYLNISAALYLDVNIQNVKLESFYDDRDFRYYTENSPFGSSQNELRINLFRRIYKFVSLLERQVDINTQISTQYTSPINIKRNEEPGFSDFGEINTTSIVF